MIRLTTILGMLTCGCAFAQTLPPLLPQDDSLVDNLLPPILQPPSSAQPLIFNRPLIIPPATLPNQVVAPLAPERPLIPEVPLLTQTVKDLVKDFQTTRQEFLRGQEELLRQLKNATGQEREIIREQLKERLNEWRELQKQHLHDLREQVDAMRQTLPALDEVLKAGSGGGDDRGSPGRR
jgi:polyhydroxyalkanoate synthesis regulator phasin